MLARNITVEASSIILVLGALANWLPHIASVLGIVWWCVMLWESKTGRWWRTHFWKPLLRWPPTIEDKTAAVFLGLAGSGVALAIVATSIVMR